MHELKEMTPPPNLILYGDSIIEAWRETSVGCPIVKHRKERRPVGGNLVAFRKVFIERYGPTVAMGIAGDTTGNLLWRLQNGEVPEVQPGAIVVHIGINDFGRILGAACLDLPPPTRRKQICKRTADDFGTVDADNVYFGIKAVIRELWGRCQVPIVLTGLFPTGRMWPRNVYGKVVPQINRLLAELADSSLGKLHMIDCSYVVLNTTTGHIDKRMMPDHLHPSPIAMVRWAECLKPTLDHLLSCHLK